MKACGVVMINLFLLRIHSLGGKPVSQNLKLNGVLSLLQGETLVTDCCFKTDPQTVLHPVIRVSRMLAHFLQENYAYIFSSGWYPFS